MSTESIIALLSGGSARGGQMGAGRRQSIGARLVLRLRHRYPWYDLPKPLGVAMLIAIRVSLQRNNLQTPPGVHVNAPQPKPAQPGFAKKRMPDGSWNDLSHPMTGMVATPFARNMPAERTAPDDARMREPNPRTVSDRLLKRDGMIAATNGNVLIAAWIQFMIHDWIQHGPGQEANPWRISTGSSRTADLTVTRLPSLPTNAGEVAAAARGTAPASGVFANAVTHWWDGSQIYGTPEKAAPRRGDKLILGVDPVAVIDRLKSDADPNADAKPSGPVSEPGFWLGMGMMQVLFAQEHNAICDMLAEAYPRSNAGTRFQQARLINTALLAKIHTTEWTPAVTAHPTAAYAVRGAWYGLAGKRVHDLRDRLRESGTLPPRAFGGRILFGSAGSRRDDHGVPFALTEAFSAVYRMHQLLPDQFTFRSAVDNRPFPGAPTGFGELTGIHGAGLLQTNELADLFFTFGTTHPGVVTLHNVPDGLRDLKRTIRSEDGSSRVDSMDLATIDILRCRELGVPRYTEFRRQLGLRVPKSFGEITSNRTWAAELEDVYGTIDEVDLLTGMYAEDRPEGFAFSDTAFHIFILMASRRISCDRFLTDSFTADVYTREGLRWIRDNTMKTVLVRHLPALAPHLDHIPNAFGYWTPKLSR